MKALIDANVVISGLRFQGTPRRVLDICNQEYIEAVISDEVLAEVKEVLLTKFHLTTTEWMAVDEVLRETFTIVVVPIFPPVSRLRDPNDSHILIAAEVYKVDIIVSGDKDLLTLKTYNSIPIVNPTDFLEILETRKLL